ncbi:MAG: hypothetical protein ACQESZ_08430 [Bacteroidota bacterium]
MDGQVVGIPEVNNVIENGVVRITLNDSVEKVAALAAVLQHDVLAVGLHLRTP